MHRYIHLWLWLMYHLLFMLEVSGCNFGAFLLSPSLQSVALVLVFDEDCDASSGTGCGCQQAGLKDFWSTKGICEHDHSCCLLVSLLWLSYEWKIINGYINGHKWWFSFLAGPIPGIFVCHKRHFCREFVCTSKPPSGKPPMHRRIPQEN